jgi:16S rRNA (guanine527-N7)-methyltransferase
VVDVGSGGGFPAIPLAISCPGLILHLVESVGWKVDFLNDTAAKLDINKRVTAHHARAEDVVPSLGREVFDVGTARAVANPAVVAEYLAPLVRVGGLLALWTTSAACVEFLTPTGQEAIATPLGLGEPELVTVSSPLRDDAVIIRWPKISSTDLRFPRRAGSARRGPL